MKDYEKQIEEAAIESSNGAWNESDWTSGFIYGAISPEAKEYWQQGMYTEEDMNLAFNAGKLSFYDGESFNSWIDQNKKK